MTAPCSRFFAAFIEILSRKGQRSLQEDALQYNLRLERNGMNKTA
jgi:hypothetical protein